MTILVKLGGSLITDKRVEAVFRSEVMERLATEIHNALQQQPALRLVLGHGSGSFGHFAAKQYNTAAGVYTAEAWRGFAEVATVAAQLNALVAATLLKAGVPVWRIQPSASAFCENGQLVKMETFPIQHAIERGIVPLVYGDVALDSVRGGTIISTETVFDYLARVLPVQQIILFGDVEGVYDATGKIIPRITPGNFSEVQGALGESAGVDVTGGMYTKVRDMLALVRAVPGLAIRIASGTQPDLLRKILCGEAQPGTLIENS